MIFGFDIEGWLCGLLLSAAAALFNMYSSIVGSVSASDLLTGGFTTLFSSPEVWNFVNAAHQTVVIPLGESILALFMLVQLVKISQRIDATSTLPAVKDIVFLAVIYVLLHWAIVNSLGIVTAIYNEFNKFSVYFASTESAPTPFSGVLDWSDGSDCSIGGCLILLIFAFLSMLIGFLTYIIAFVVAMARAIQLYVMAAFSPIPLALLGFDDTRQMGIGFLKNFCAIALAGAIMLFLIAAYPYVAASTTSVIGNGDGLLAIATVGIQDSIGAFLFLLQWLAVNVLLILGLVKSGAWAREVLGG